MALRECDARPTFQIALEPDGACFIGELDD
jgi:hypothetical protein